jgi:pantoate ligase / CMP/dCMP kinase
VKGDFRSRRRQTFQAIAERDAKDSNRAISPLRKAVDAQELVTDGMSIEQVVGQIIRWYRAIGV